MVCCILPQKHLLHYDITAVQQCAEEVLGEVAKAGGQSIVAHTFSNNGFILYQQLYTILQKQGKLDNFIKVSSAIFNKT